MRNRLAALAVVLVFAAAVTAVAVTAGGGGRSRLVKLPVAAAAEHQDAAASPAAGASLSFPAVAGVDYRPRGELPRLASEAPAYRLGAAASADAVARLARALGVAGAVREHEHGWAVGDGQRELRVNKAPGLPWYLGAACPEAPVSSDDGPTAVVACPASPGPVAGNGGKGSTGSAGAAASSPSRATPPPPDAPTEPAPCPPGTECAAPEPAPGPEKREPPETPAPPPRPADLPTRQEAERVARELFARLGVSTERLAVEDGYVTWEARAERRVGGVPVLGWQTTASIGPRGEVKWASGHLAEPERIGDYPLAGTDKGFERLRQSATAGPTPLVARDEPAHAEPSEPVDCSKPTVMCDPPPPTEPVVRTVTGAHLALLHLDATLVPVYVFELDGGDWSPPVPAVTEEWLDRA